MNRNWLPVLLLPKAFRDLFPLFREPEPKWRIKYSPPANWERLVIERDACFECVYVDGVLIAKQPRADAPKRES